MKNIFINGVVIYILMLLGLYHDHANTFIYWSGIISLSCLSGMFIGTFLGKLDLAMQQ